MCKIIKIEFSGIIANKRKEQTKQNNKKQRIKHDIEDNILI